MNAIIRPARRLWLTFDQIDIPDNARPTNATDVVALARSIEALGLQVPLTCIERDGRYLLIAGRHRLEALRVLGQETAPVRVVDFDDVEARLWTISENLHRTELSVTQRSELIAEYARLAKQRRETERGQVSAQLAPSGRRHFGPTWAKTPSWSPSERRPSCGARSRPHAAGSSAR
jgi:ParB family chromosome partitioning protein